MQGDGPRMLVMLHGLSQSHETFLELVERIGADHRVCLVDLPGHGQSGRLEQYAVQPMVEAVIRLLEKQGRPVDLYGHSLGSLVAMGVAARVPERVGRVILSDPPLVFWDEPRWRESVISRYFGWARKALRSGMDEAELVNRLQAAFPHRSDTVLQRQARGLLQLDVDVIETLFEKGLASEAEIFSWLADIGSPVLLLQADPRILAAADDADVARMQEVLQDCAHVKFDKADHDLHLWKIDRVADAVARFLNHQGAGDA